MVEAEVGPIFLSFPRKRTRNIKQKEEQNRRNERETKATRHGKVKDQKDHPKKQYEMGQALRAGQPGVGFFPRKPGRAEGGGQGGRARRPTPDCNGWSPQWARSVDGTRGAWPVKHGPARRANAVLGSTTRLRTRLRKIKNNLSEAAQRCMARVSLLGWSSLLVFGGACAARLRISGRGGSRGKEIEAAD